MAGKVTDKNSPYLCKELRILGVEVKQIITIPDVPEVIGKTALEFSKSFNWVFTSGGIGPTLDDLTVASIAKEFGAPLYESTKIMDKVLIDTKFLPEKSGRNVLSSQYYKKNRIVQKYFNDDYDFYVQIRSDITIDDFPTVDLINSIIDKKSLVVSKYYWYNEPYIGTDCNEMINCSTRNVFKELNEIYLNEEKISKQLDYHYGERVTGKHILNMIQSGSIDNLCVFDFGFRVIR